MCRPSWCPLPICKPDPTSCSLDVEGSQACPPGNSNSHHTIHSVLNDDTLLCLAFGEQTLPAARCNTCTWPAMQAEPENSFLKYAVIQLKASMPMDRKKAHILAALIQLYSGNGIMLLMVTWATLTSNHTAAGRLASRKHVIADSELTSSRLSWSIRHSLSQQGSIHYVAPAKTASQTARHVPPPRCADKMCFYGIA